PTGIAIDTAGSLYVADYYSNLVHKVVGGTVSTVACTGAAGFSGDGGPATRAELNQPYVVALDSGGNLYIADFGNNRIRVIGSNGNIYTAAGNGTVGLGGDSGPPLSAQLHFPSGMAFDSAGNLYFADSQNNRIREISSGIITTVAGDGTTAQLNQPSAVAFDSAGSLYIADTGNNRIRKVTAGNMTTFAGDGTPTQLN